MSHEFRVRIQTGGQSYKTLPMDGELASELADAMAEVREAAEDENVARNTYVNMAGLDELQRHINRRREMEERAVELFRAILGNIPAYLVEHPIPERTGGHRRKSEEAA